MNRRTFLAALGTALAAPFVPRVPVKFKTRTFVTLGAEQIAKVDALLFNGVPITASHFVRPGHIVGINDKLYYGVDVMLYPGQCAVITNIEEPDYLAVPAKGWTRHIDGVLVDCIDADA